LFVKVDVLWLPPQASTVSGCGLLRALVFSMNPLYESKEVGTKTVPM